MKEGKQMTTDITPNQEITPRAANLLLIIGKEEDDLIKRNWLPIKSDTERGFTDFMLENIKTLPEWIKEIKTERLLEMWEQYLLKQNVSISPESSLNEGI